MRGLGATGTALALLLAGPACRRPAAADPVLLRLGEETVQRSEFQQHLHRLESRGEEPFDAAVRAAVLEKFLEERVLALEARRRGLVPAGAGEEAETAGIRRLLDSEVVSRLEVAPAEVEGYFHEHAGEWSLPERRSVSQILLPNLNEARDVRRRLERDPKSFEIMARTRSRGPEASSGGRMGTFAPGELPAELDRMVFALRVGEHSPIVESPYGFHVLRVDALEPARERPLEECRAEIHARLRSLRSDEAVRAFIRELLSRAQVNHEAANPLPAAS